MVADLKVLVVRQTKSWDWMFGSMAAKPSNFGLARYYDDGGATGGYWHHETHNGSGGGQNHKPAFCATNEWHVVSYSPPESVTIDGVDYATGFDDSGFVETGYQINLFRNQKQGASVYDQSMYGRISSFRLSTPSQTVRSFVPAADPSPLAAGPSSNPGTLSIYGRYTPKSVYGQMYRLMDGSTLDLSLWTGVWNCTNTEGLDLTFADGAKVAVALGNRTKEELQEIIDGDGFIVKWTTEPAATVEFAVDEATCARHYRVKRVAGGLRLRMGSGMMIIVR